MKIRCLLFYVLALNTILTAGQNQFNIKMWGMTVASVSIIGADSTYVGLPARFVSFSSQTVSLANTIYPVESEYITWSDSNYQRILSYQKNSIQPGIVNNLKTITANGEVVYQNSMIQIPKETFNIFLFLDYLRYHRYTRTFEFLLEREGLIFPASVTLVSGDGDIVTYALEIQEIPLDGNTAVLQKTDIFTWAVFTAGADRYITVDYNSHQIIRCEFQSGIFKLSADLVR